MPAETKPSSTPAATPTPSSSLIASLREALARHPPFSLMAAADVDRWVGASHEVYFAPDEVICQASDGPVDRLYWLKRGRVTGRRGLADLVDSGVGFEFEIGDLFPVAAMLASRPVTATYRASEDCFCLVTPAAVVRELAAESPVLADFLNQRVQLLLALSRRAMQTTYAAQVLADQALDTPLVHLLAQQRARKPVSVPRGTPLREALSHMQERRVGSVLVTEGERPVGILTRYDLLGRVTLPGVPLHTPIDAVMSQPVQTLDQQATALDAALLMSRHGIRHVPIVDAAAAGRLVSIVSERDLFALQRLSLKSLTTSLRAAPDLPTLIALAGDIRRYAANLLGQGVQARQLTELVSHLNDALTARCVVLVAERHGLDLSRAAWLAFGSEGRGEQTVATDQDNGLVFESVAPEVDRPRWLALGAEVNQALDAAGYPLCKGGIMAGRAECCLSLDEWQARFTHWIGAGAPQDLLNASIYFDLRAVAGDARLAHTLREQITQEAARWPRFLKQMADNVLRDRVPLNWRGGIDATLVDGRPTLDLKLQGTAIVVGIARLYALTHQIPATTTAERLRAAGPWMKASQAESEAWVRAFEYLQMLRLQVQLHLPATDGSGTGTADATHPNRVHLDRLNDIDRRMLKEALRVIDRLRQRVELDHGA
jgi:CBS domain-containing protein